MIFMFVFLFGQSSLESFFFRNNLRNLIPTTDSLSEKEKNTSIGKLTHCQLFESKTNRFFFYFFNMRLLLGTQAFQVD